MDYYADTVSYLREKLTHPGIIKHTKNLGWMFFARIGSMVISFIATAYIARNLGPTNYGELSYAVSYVSIFGFLAAFGIDQILCRDLIKYPSKRNEYLGTAIILRLVASAVTFILCFLSAVFLSPKDVSLMLIFIVGMTFIFSSFQLLSYEFQAEVNLKYPSILTMVLVLILNILKIITIFYGGGVIYLAGIILLEPILYMIGIIYLRTREYGTIKNWKFDEVVAVSIVRDSFPLIFASAFISIYTRIDQVMIKNMMDAKSVGLYDSAVRISELWYFIPHTILAGIFPSIINAKLTSEKLFSERTKKIFFFLLSLSTLTAIFTVFLSKYLILIIFGAGFIGALGVLKIYVWSNISVAINMLIQNLLIAENLTKIISVGAFFGMFTNIILNIIFIPKYGIVGAAYATLISYIVPLLIIFMFKKSRKLILGIFKK